VGEASRLDHDRGKMPLPHGNHDRNRNAILTIAQAPALLRQEYIDQQVFFVVFLWERLSASIDRRGWKAAPTGEM
jgi:hypothetical protein